MARYYEETALIEFVKKYTPTINGETTMKCVVRAIREAPTADAVPKSEVEELKAIIADHKANEERWQELYADTVDKWEKAYEELEIKLETIKTEVAREIFEEIERLCDAHLYWNNCSIIQRDDIAELKKKYIKGD